MDNKPGPVRIQADDGSPSQEGPKTRKMFSVPAPVVELLQTDIEIRNAAMDRWQQKLASAAILSGVPEGSKFQFKQNDDGTFVFLIEE